MSRSKIINVLAGMLLMPGGYLFSQSVYSCTHYHTGQQVQQVLSEINQKHKASTRVHTIAESPGGAAVSLLEIGSDLKDVPAIFVGANFEGNMPVATEGALRLIQMLLDSGQYTSSVKWYILPLPNPDAAVNFFSDAKYGRTVNDFDINDDADDALNEDGYEDLNGDGYITLMRKKATEGTHLISDSDPRIMIKSNPDKGERGEYNIYREGIDNDNDGEYNEDGPGGINIGISFPHLFPEKKKEAGLWPGQAPEVYGIHRFIYGHPEIAMVHTLGSSDFCITPPEGGRKGEMDLNRIKIPERYVSRLNADANKTYTLDEVVELVRKHLPGGEDMTPQMVAGTLGFGEAVNPPEEDLDFYTRFSEEYLGYLKSRNFVPGSKDAPPAKDGSFELWAYYHLGVPSFSMNIFSAHSAGKAMQGKENIPSAGEIEKMNAQEFISLGEQKINALLEAYDASDSYSAVKTIRMLKNGTVTPAQLIEELRKATPKDKGSMEVSRQKALLAWSDSALNGNGFANWQPYKHPQLGEVEIGGFIPYMESAPRAGNLDSLLSVKLPWLLQLSKKLPEISFASEELVDKGAGIYKLDLYIENTGQLPYPIAMGQRNSQPAPLVIVLEGDFELLEGLKRTPVKHIGSNQVKKLSWLIKRGDEKVITARMESAVFPDRVKQITTGKRL